MELNLARDAFRNLRPVKRAGLLFAVLGLALTALDVRTYWRHFSGENQTRVRLQALDAEIAAEREELEQLREKLSRLEVGALNQRAVFVNEQIAQRTFSWSGLFDDLVSILPPQAQLVSLEPQFDRGASRHRQEELGPDEVLLEIEGLARDTQRLLSLIDRFFQHPSFRRPDLKREAKGEHAIEFTLSVVYRPQERPAPEAPEPPEEEGRSEGETAAATQPPAREERS